MSYTLTYSAPTVDATEHYATRAEAEAGAAEARAAMVAVGYGAHVDSIRITEDDAPAAPVYISPITALSAYAPHAGHVDDTTPARDTRPAVNLPRALPMGYARRLVDGHWQNVEVI